MTPFIAGFADELQKLGYYRPGTAPKVSVPQQAMRSPPKMQAANWRPSPKYRPQPAAKVKSFSAGPSGRNGSNWGRAPKNFTAPTRGYTTGRAFTATNEKFPSRAGSPMPVAPKVKASPTTLRPRAYSSPADSRRRHTRGVNENIGGAAWGGA